MPAPINFAVAGRHQPRLDADLTDVRPDSIAFRLASARHRKFWLELRVTRAEVAAMLAAMDAEAAEAGRVAKLPKTDPDLVIPW